MADRPATRGHRGQRKRPLAHTPHNSPAGPSAAGHSAVLRVQQSVDSVRKLAQVAAETVALTNPPHQVDQRRHNPNRSHDHPNRPRPIHLPLINN